MRRTTIQGLIKLYLSMAGGLLLFGCATNNPPSEPVKLNDVSLMYSRLAAVQEGMVTTQLELEELIREFDLRDELEGGWLASLELCRYHRTTGIDESGAMASCDDAWRRAGLNGSSEAIFLTAVQLYQYRGEPNYLSTARRHATSDYDAQLLAVLTKDVAAIQIPELAHPSSAVRAYQYYWVGKDRGDDTLLTQAYQLFAGADNARGMADTQFLRAQLAADEGRFGAAEHLAQRAAQMMRALGATTEAEEIQGWLDRELAAR